MDDDSTRSFFERRLRLSNGGNGDAAGAADATGAARPAGAAGPADPADAADAADAADLAADARIRLHLAACVLLLELAHADDEFSAIERAHIEAVLRRHFSLDADTARELMEAADMERRAADDLFPFATLIREGYDRGQKTLLAEIMWGLILADGEIARHEAHLLRRIADLLDLEPGYLADAGEP